MKKVTALLMAALLVFSLAGCGQKEEAESKGEEKKTTEAAKSETKAAQDETSGGPGESGEASGDPIKIGLTTVLTGDRSLEGQDASNAVELIEEEINGAGGVLGRPVEVVIEDALGTDVGAVNAYRKLAADEDIVAIIGPDSSNDGMAQSPSALEFEILTTAQGSSPTLRDMCNNDNEWLFQLRACDETLCAALIKYAVEDMGLESFAILHDTETSSADQARLFTEALAAYDIEPEVVVPFTTGTKDFSSQIAQVQNSGAEAIIGAAFQTEAAILVTQIRSMGMDVPILGSNAFADPVTIQLAGDATDDVYCASAWVPNTPNPKGNAFAAKYQETYGEECGKAAAQIYDHVSIICEAIERAGSTDRAAVRDAMNTIDSYEGAITTYDCRTNGDCGRGGLLVRVQDQKAEIIAQITSEKVID